MRQLWERSQELPDGLIERQLANRERQREDQRRAPRPGWDLRLVPAAVTAWAAALLGADDVVLPPGRPVLLTVCLAVVCLVVAAALLRRRLAQRGKRSSVAGALRASAPTLVLCALLAATILLRAGAQGDEAQAHAGTLGQTAQRIVLEVTDRPVAWHGSGGGFGTSPEQIGEGGSGVVVPVRTPGGAQATLFADDERWRVVTPGQRVQAVVVDPQAAGGQLQLSTSSPPAPVQDRPAGALEAAKQRFALLAAARGPDAAGLLPGMTYGDRTGLDPALEQAMKETGLTHLTAVSGSNCALVMALAGQLGLGLGLRRRMCLVFGVGALALFVLLVGPDPSVLRAAVMGSIAALAVLSGRGPVSLSALSTAMCVLLVIDPRLGLEYGFALSVAATAGIVVTGRPLLRVLERALPTTVAVVLTIPLVAQLWCGPIVALLSPTVAVYSLPANVLAAPVVPAVTLLGLSGLILLGLGGPVGEAAGQVIMVPGDWLTRLIAWIARWLADLPGASPPWPAAPLGPLLMLGLSAVVVVAIHGLDARWSRRVTRGEVVAGPAPGPLDDDRWRRHIRRRRRWRAAAVLVGLAGIVTVVALLRWPADEPGDWEVIVCDVGQGDALLLRGRQGRESSTVLIDAGPDPGAVRGCLRDARVVHLDLLVLTHDHDDHVAGAEGLGQVVDIDEVWWSSATGRAPLELAELTARARRPGLGEVLEVPGLRLRVLGPEPGSTRVSPESEDENNASLVLRADLAAGAQGNDGFSVLAAGDLEETGLGPVLRGDPETLDVDLLKLSHHGARNGGTRIIDAASPALAIVSVGEDNTYGHPHPLITEHVARAGVPLARTDQHGTIRIRAEHGRLEATGAP